MLLKKERSAPALPRLRACRTFSRPRPGSGMAAERMRWLRRGCRKTARRITRHFGTLWGASFRAFAALLPPPFAPFSAPGSIAAKPQKPCDGGVFRAFYLLLKKERSAPALPRLRACRTFSRPRPGCDWAAVRPLLFDRSPPGPFAARLSPHGCAGSGTANEARRPKGRTPRGGLRGAFERF